jgi:two-component system, OmpR family, sensor histidine kinase BaeS
MRLSIKYKLFFIILSAHALVYVAMYSAGYYNFSRGFLDYVSRIEERQVPALLDGLEDFYQTNGSWEPIRKDNDVWLSLIRRSIETATDPDLIAARGRRNERPPPGFDPNDWYYNSEYSPARPYLHILDADKKIVRGFVEAFSVELATLNPIIVEGATVGYLAVTSRQQLSEQADLLFSEQQKNDFRLLAIVLALISAGIAFPAATILTRPVREVVAGTRALTSGNYNTRVPIRGSDELSQLSEDLNTLAKTLDQNQTARQQWIADISHELRTPLAIMRGELEAVQDGIRPLNAETLDSLHQEVVHLNTLVNDLHELSLSDIGSLIYKKEPLNLAEILDSCIEKHGPLAHKHQLTVTLKIDSPTHGQPTQGQPTQEHASQEQANPEQELPIVGDPDRLLQLFDNLLQNSCRYTHSGGEVRVHAYEDGGHILVAWYDSAPGVSDKDLEHLFDRLYRVEMSRNRAKGGSGLGLAICQNIVNAHDGSIAASHSPLGGLKLTMAFPRYQHKDIQ